MKKIVLATAAAAAVLTGAAAWQPADAQTRYARHHDGWVWNNPVAIGAGAIVGTAAALATAPLWAVAGGPYYGYDYAYAPGYYPAYGYGYGYAPPVYAPAPVVYTTRVAPRRVVYRTRTVAPRRVVRSPRVVAPRRAVTRTVIHADRRAPVQRGGLRTVRY